MAITTTTQDVVHLLEQDHKKVKGLLKELQSAEGREAKSLLKTITKELQIHSMVEEEIVYPSYRSSIGTGDAKIEVEESLAEHENVDQLLADLASRNPSTAAFKGRAKFLKEAVEHHVKEEEKSMLPGLRRALNKQKLEELGKKVQKRKEQMQGSSSRSGGGSATSTRTGKTPSSNVGSQSRMKKKAGGKSSGSKTGSRSGTTASNAGARSTKSRPSGKSTRSNAEGPSRDDLYQEAKRRNIPGRSGMDKKQLQQALQNK